MVDTMILPARDGFAVYNLKTNAATHFKSSNWSSLDTKTDSTEEAVKEFESFREHLGNEKK